ncbi:MAG: peptidoglycan-binding protein [Sulfurovum sp.]|nr:peptidoglycan-binding protein [Sulfurovum sp.]
MKIKYSTLLVSFLLPFTALNAADIALTPPDAKPGECYAKVMTPAKFETVEEQVLVKEAGEEISIVPAEYEVVEQEVQVLPASKKLIPVPATYKDVTETIEVQAATRVWKDSLKKKGSVVNSVLLDAIKAQGIDLDAVTPNNCLKEIFKPATYKVETEEILVQNERNATEVVPAEYETVEEQVEVIPATKEVVQIPAEYETVEEQILVEEEKTVWKKGENPAQKLSGSTGDIMCLVKVPAKYKTVKKQVLKSPARTEIKEIPAVIETIAVQKMVSEPTLKHEIVPAVYEEIEKKVLEAPASFQWVSTDAELEENWKETGKHVCLVEKAAVTKEVTKTVLDTPATVEEEVIPATFELVKVKKLVSEAKEVKTPIEAEYNTIEKSKKVSDSTVVWERILCQTNMTKDVIKKIQNALNEKSYNVGKPDGILGNGTKNVIEKFQTDNSLSTGGITYETLDALNIEL